METVEDNTRMPLTVKDKLDTRARPKQKKYFDFVLFEDYNQEMDTVLQEIGLTTKDNIKDE